MKKELLKEKLEEIKSLFDKYTIEELVATFIMILIIMKKNQSTIL